MTINSGVLPHERPGGVCGTTSPWKGKDRFSLFLFASLPCYVLKVSLRAPAVTPGSKDVYKE